MFTNVKIGFCGRRSFVWQAFGGKNSFRANNRAVSVGGAGGLCMYRPGGYLIDRTKLRRFFYPVYTTCVEFYHTKTGYVAAKCLIILGLATKTI